MSYCFVEGCPGEGYPYRITIRTADGVRRIVLCTFHRKVLEVKGLDGVEILDVVKRDPGPSRMANPYVDVLDWPHLPLVLPPV